MTAGARVWRVAALCRAIADAIETRLNPVTVAGEISGFSRASSGHCYFSVKDEQSQLRCAMFRRASGLLNFSPKDGDQVELRGRLGVYEQRGELQLVVESMSRAGQGGWYERFAQLKAKLDALGLFDATRKRSLPSMPRGIGLVTSLGAAALHDVASALKRRVPHIPVVLVPAQVQGQQAAADMVQALHSLYALARGETVGAAQAPIDVILLVRGGGSLEDLWAFNDEALVHCIAASPVPIICGVGHETDFTLADFCADVRAPTPTAAVELLCAPRAIVWDALQQWQYRLSRALAAAVDAQHQRVDFAVSRLGRPSATLARSHLRLASLAQRLRHAGLSRVAWQRQRTADMALRLPSSLGAGVALQRHGLDRLSLRLQSLDPALVLQRGYAWLENQQGVAVASVHELSPGQLLSASLADGVVDLSVRNVCPN